MVRGLWIIRKAIPESAAPIIGPAMYIHRLAKSSDTSAGASERAGFIDAPVIGPAQSTDSPTTPPIALPAIIPFSILPVETLRIINMRNSVITISRMKDCIRGPEG